MINLRRPLLLAIDRATLLRNETKSIEWRWRCKKSTTTVPTNKKRSVTSHQTSDMDGWSCADAHSQIADTIVASKLQKMVESTHIKTSFVLHPFSSKTLWSASLLTARWIVTRWVSRKQNYVHWTVATTNDPPTTSATVCLWVSIHTGQCTTNESSCIVAKYSHQVYLSGWAAWLFALANDEVAVLLS